MANFLKQVENIASTYSADTIFILGKGASVDRVDVNLLANALVIGINDAERIVPCDITIFHAEWVLKALDFNDWRSKLYITSERLTPERNNFIKSRYVPSTQEGTDVMMSRLVSKNPELDFVIEEVLFLSALRLSRLIGKLRGKKQKVYMIGFDFSTDKGYASAVTHDYSQSESSIRNTRINPQEFYFVNTLYTLRDSEIEIIHVGDRSFSKLTPEELNRLFIPAETESNDQLRERVLITAELTTNHFGDRHRLERMIRAAHSSGADLIKIQKRDVETFYSKKQLDSKYVSPFGKTFRDYRHALELSIEDFEFVDDLCNKLNIDWFASVLDEPSFRFIQEFEPELIKLPSTISEHKDYLANVANNHKGGIVLSTGMTDKKFEKWFLDTFNKTKKLFLLQCNSAYPTPNHDCNIAVIRHYRDLAKKNPQIIPGYSSHDLGSFASTLAVAAGAKMLEKHVKLGNTEWAHFDAVAMDLTTSEFTNYVRDVREAEMIMGSEEKKVNESEHHKYFKS